MAFKHESQKEILSKRNPESVETLVLFNQTRGQPQKGKQKKYDPRKGYCIYHNMDGHVRNTYFKLIRYPDWFKKKIKNGGQFARQDKGRNNSQRLIAITEGLEYKEDNPFDMTHITPKINDFSAALSAFEHEFSRLLKGKAALIATTMDLNSSPDGNPDFGSHTFASNYNYANP